MAIGESYLTLKKELKTGDREELKRQNFTTTRLQEVHQNTANVKRQKEKRRKTDEHWFHRPHMEKQTRTKANHLKKVTDAKQEHLAPFCRLKYFLVSSFQKDNDRLIY